MEVTRRTQTERSDATRAALVEAARLAFGAEGFSAVGTTAVARDAGVSRGALYHQFADKVELFAAVFEAVEVDVAERLAAELGDAAGPVEALRRGIEAWLDVCAEAEVRQIVLLDGPVVLGWERWREIGLRYGGGLVEAVLESAMADGSVPRSPVAPLAHLLLGALDEAALYVASAGEPDRARAEMASALGFLIEGLLASPTD